MGCWSKGRNFSFKDDLSSGHLMYNMVTVVNNTIIYLKVAKSVDLTCSDHKKEIEILK